MRSSRTATELHEDPHDHVDPHDAVAPAVEAATVALLRDSDDGLEVLLLRRTEKAGFVPGAHVFAGGAVDDSDALGTHLVQGVTDAVASSTSGVASGGLRFWMAAVRESLEEAGVAPGVRSASPGSQEPVDLGPWRDEVHAGRLSLAGALGAAGARIDGSALRCIARWVTPVWSPRRFDTRFFIASAPEGAEVSHDGSEAVGHEWLRPRDALDAARTGRITMIMPTVRTLAALDAFDTTDRAMAGLRFGDPAEPLLPEMSQAPDGRTLAVLSSDPESNGGVYDSDTGDPVLRSPTG